MKFEILNVEHGFCAYAIGSDARVTLFDCGHSPSVRPSDLLPAMGIRSVQRLVVTNYDEDHISDLVALRRKVNIEVLTRNPSMTSAELRSLKTPPISHAMSELLSMIDSYTGPVEGAQLESQGTRVWTFHNQYPEFWDTNNLSLLTFVSVGGELFALGGDLERPGWRRLLQDPHVRGLLRSTTVFVASHHGRENGYCPEVFEFCSPNLVVVSDGAIEYDTQAMTATYGGHATGSWFTTPSGSEFRKVVTTRCDGNIYWNF